MKEYALLHPELGIKVEEGFACSNDQCIRGLWKCDGSKNCDDGSDETTELCGADCESVGGGGFACSNGQCIKARDKCNGVKVEVLRFNFLFYSNLDLEWEV